MTIVSVENSSNQSYNYTFNSLGTIGAILLMNFYVTSNIEKEYITPFHFSTLICIFLMYRNYNFHFDKTNKLILN